MEVGMATWIVAMPAVPLFEDERAPPRDPFPSADACCARTLFRASV